MRLLIDTPHVLTSLGAVDAHYARALLGAHMVRPGALNDKVQATFRSVAQSAVCVGDAQFHFCSEHDRAYLLRLADASDASVLYDQLLTDVNEQTRPHVRLVAELWQTAYPCVVVAWLRMFVVVVVARPRAHRILCSLH